jgi:hypothetical protein
MCGACRRPAGERILAAILLTIILAAFEGSAARAQERAPNSSTLPSSSESLKAADGDGQAASASASPEPLRVPRPSGHLSRLGPVAGSPQPAARAPGSSGWWLGSAGITLVLAVCGAICIAARNYWPRESAGSLRDRKSTRLNSSH